MVSATVLFQDGWKHRTEADSTEEDPDTGEKVTAPGRETTGRGLLQQALWTNFKEVTDRTVVDERMVLFEPPAWKANGFEIVPTDEFFSPEGRCWQVITAGLPRGIPGHKPTYYAARVRRAKEKDR